MGEGFKNWFARNSSSLKIFLFAVPLILVSGFASLLVQKGTNWALIYTLPTSSSNTNLDAVKKPSLQAKERDSPIDSLSQAVVSVDNGRSRKEALSNETAIGTVSPPIVAQSLQLQHLNGKNENKPSLSISGNFNSTNSIEESESIELPLKRRRKRVRTSLDRLEEGLRRARIAIKEAINGSQLQDPDYTPYGPIYKNAKVFHRSYLEMEKQFKIFVYEEGELPLFHDGPCMLLYTMEGQFINKMEVNKKFRTHNPEKAHVFFLPYSVTRMVHYIWVPGMHLKPLGRIVSDYVNVIADKHPYWNRSRGADHFMLSCHDWGPVTSFFVPDLVENSIRALCNANTSERFNPTKDVSIPEITLKSHRLEGLIGGPSPSQRTILAFFAGGNHGFVRGILFRHWEKEDPDIRVHDYLPGRASYYDIMRKTKYCLCPSGYEVASPRVVESLYSGCVPVLISKSYVPPFSDVLNWKTFSVMVSLEEIPKLKKILLSIPDRQYIRMQKRVVQVRKHFELNATPKRFDVFHMILHSIWLRRLNVRINNDPRYTLD